MYNIMLLIPELGDVVVCTYSQELQNYQDGLHYVKDKHYTVRRVNKDLSVGVVGSPHIVIPYEHYRVMNPAERNRLGG